ncbi:hypothetical protein QVD99_000871 [Batrachochytrium dendrobatidis]|nr:hypothetical protein QVD99_000871 [Batrachochytrium dendrobatidis]
MKYAYKLQTILTKDIKLNSFCFHKMVSLTQIILTALFVRLSAAIPAATGDDPTCGPGLGRCDPGECCSQYGYCDVTPAHCGVGCQPAFGVCKNTPTSTSRPKPSPTPKKLPESPDSTCGQAAGYRCAQGDCCSQYNFCGNTAAHCGAGCQSAFGTCKSPTRSSSKGGPTPAPTSSFPIPDPKLSAPVITTCKSPKQFALTFDDGPTSNVSAILDMLKDNNVKATFFVNGNNFADLTVEPYISILRRAHTEGHQIASHTLTHPDMTKLNAAQMWDEMSQNDVLIRNIIGKSPIYMRPPFGNVNALVLSAMATWGYQVVTWNIDSADWEHNGSPNMIAENDASYAEGMAGHPIPATPFISLQHDFVDNEIGWARHVITRFKKLGYNFVTVGECLGVPASQWYR